MESFPTSRYLEFQFDDRQRKRRKRLTGGETHWSQKWRGKSSLEGGEERRREESSSSEWIDGRREEKELSKQGKLVTVILSIQKISDAQGMATCGISQVNTQNLG